MPHPNARLTPHGRALLANRIRAGWTITAAARAAGISRQTGSKWWHRAQAGLLTDRSSAVHRQARRHPADLVTRLCARRRELRVGPHILAWRLGAPAVRCTRSFGARAWDGSIGSSREPPVVRYERERPGELVHLDTKMLGRIDQAAVTGSSGSTGIEASAGTGSTSRSTTTAGSRTQRSSPMSRRSPRPDSSSEPGASTQRTASRSSGS